MTVGNIYRSVIIPAVIIVAGFSAAIPLNAHLTSTRPELAAGYSDSDLDLQGSRLKGYALGSEGLLADWYFMRSLQYIGSKMIEHEDGDINLDDLRALNPRLLYPMLENATDLDPHFIAAYTYGAMVLPAIDPEQAIRLARKGIANNPDEWRLNQHLGYIFWKLGSFDEAAAAYESGATKPGAAPFMRLMAASMRSEGGSRTTARSIFQQMRDGSDDEAIKATAERRLLELRSLDEIDAINAKLADFKTRNGRCVNSLSEILPAISGVKLPDGDFQLDNANHLADPTGVAYLLDKNACQALVDKAKTGLPVKK